MKSLKKLATLTALGLLTLSTAYAQELDSDADEISDAVELERGTDPLISGFPSFEGVFFKDLKIINTFKNKLDERKDTEFSISQNVAGAVEKDQSHYYKTLLALNFQTSDYGKLRIHDSKTHIYNSAIATESQIHKMAQENDKLTKAGYLPTSIQLEFNNDIKFKSNTYLKITNPVYKLYYQDGPHLVYIGSFNDRNVYTAGADAKSVPMIVNITDPDIVAGLYASQSRYLVIQIDNLYFPEIGKYYEELEQKMDKKTTAVTVFEANKVETYHVATTATDSLNTVLETAFGTKYTEPSWQVLTARGLNVFASDYQIGYDNILLNFADEKVTPLKVGTSTFKQVPGKEDKVFVQTQRLRDFAFIISDITTTRNEPVVTTGIEKVCGKKPDINKVSFKYYNYKTIKKTLSVTDQSNLNSFLQDQELSIGNSVYNLMELVTKGFINYAFKNSNLELRATKEFIKVLDLENLEEVSLKLSNKAQTLNIQRGKKITACTCIFERPTPRVVADRLSEVGCRNVSPANKGSLTTVTLDNFHNYNISLITY